MVKCSIKGCKKRAKYNIQSVWHLYEIHYSKNGGERYEELKDWDGDDSDSYCEEHSKKELLYP